MFGLDIARPRPQAAASLRRIASRRAFSTIRRNLEIRRLERIPRYQKGATDLLGPRLEFPDAASFLAQYRQLFDQQLYDFSSTGAPLVVDVGANVGLSILAVKGIAPTARILAFEADPALASLARRNVRSAQLSDVTVVHAAVATFTGSATFRPDGADGGRLAPEGSITVPTVRLRDQLAAADDEVALLKLDIEGAEVDVLLDCADRLSLVRRLAFEYHSFEERPQRLGVLLATLEEQGFRICVRHELAPIRPLVDRWSYNGMDLQLNIWAWRSK